MSMHELPFLVRELADEAMKRAYERSLSTESLALMAGLHHSTVVRLVDKTTIFPRFQTVALLAMAVGMPSLQLTSLRKALASKRAVKRPRGKRD